MTGAMERAQGLPAVIADGQRPWIGLADFAHRRRWPLLLAALPFAALHLLELSGLTLLSAFIYTLFAGVLLGWCRMVTGSIWPCVIATTSPTSPAALLP